LKLLAFAFLFEILDVHLFTPVSSLVMTGDQFLTGMAGF
jgi:hypothetical protein